jgi:hypothetical protein
MVETLEPQQEIETAVQQIRRCADWLEAHDCTEFGYGIYPFRTGEPQIYVPSFDEMKRLFSGYSVNKKRDGSRMVYWLTADGIRFNGHEWIRESSSSGGSSDNGGREMATATKKTRKHMPVSKAKNAYELLQEIRKIILEEPKRYDQADTLTVGDECRHKKRQPDCGTVGCVAGWVVALTTPANRLASVARNGRILEKAALVLGIDSYLASELFYGGPIDGPPEQTVAHARAGAAHIKRFMENRKEQLKAKSSANHPLPRRPRRNRMRRRRADRSGR